MPELDVSRNPPLHYVIASALAAIGEGAAPSPPDDRRPPFWATVVESAAKAQVLPLLAAQLGAARQAGLAPRWVSGIAESAHGEATRESCTLIEIAGIVSERFQREGIPIAFRKGLRVMDLYPDPGSRPVGDIDVLVAPECAGDALAIARSIGFAEMPMTRAQRAWMSVATHTLPPLEYHLPKSGEIVVLDISTSLLLPAMREPSDRERVHLMLSRTIRSKNDLPALAAPDLLLDIMVNAYIVQTTLRYVWRLRFQRISYYLDLLVAGRELSEAELRELRSALDCQTLRDSVDFAIGNLYRLAPHAPTTALLLDGQPAPTRDVLDIVGQWELDAPYRWKQSLAERLQLDFVPDDLPPARAMI